MADYRYAYNGPQEGVAKAVLKDAPISIKVAIEISNHLRGRSTAAAKAILERVLKHEEAIPYKRFTDGVGHKPGKGVSAGRYPEKASKAFLSLLESVEANAAQAGLAEELVIKHLAAHEASRPFRYGRQRRRQVKQSHVEIAVKEDPNAKKAEKKQAKKTTPKQPAQKQESKAQTPKKPEPEQESKPAEQKPESKKEQPKKTDTVKKKPAKAAPKKDAQSQQKKESAQQ
ncbi:MAG: 50S ribosomal protein L22 [Candidatus Woesearchaeota archaeon]